MVVRSRDLWTMVMDQQQLDPNDLLAAIQDQVQRGDLDHRSRLLIRDSLEALKIYWGAKRLSAWIAACPVREKIEAIACEEFDDKVGFPSLRRRVMDITRPESVSQYLRELGAHVNRPVQLQVGGSIPLILGGYISRKTEDIDIVDEVPAEIRAQHNVLQNLENRYRLKLSHFQRHYLPSGWDRRLHSIEPMGRLQVFLVDVYDVFLSKLVSIREKDLDDLREVAPKLNKDELVRRLKTTTQSMLASAELRERARHNWYILYGEELPA